MSAPLSGLFPQRELSQDGGSTVSTPLLVRLLLSPFCLSHSPTNVGVSASCILAAVLSPLRRVQGDRGRFAVLAPLGNGNTTGKKWEERNEKQLECHRGQSIFTCATHATPPLTPACHIARADAI